jgi:hypothetical protein
MTTSEFVQYLERSLFGWFPYHSFFMHISVDYNSYSKIIPISLFFFWTMTVLALDTYRAEILKNYPWDGFAEIDGNFLSANGGCFPRKMRNHQDFVGGWAFVSS